MGSAQQPPRRNPTTTSRGHPTATSGATSGKAGSNPANDRTSSNGSDAATRGPAQVSGSATSSRRATSSPNQTAATTAYRFSGAFVRLPSKEDATALLAAARELTGDAPAARAAGAVAEAGVLADVFGGVQSSPDNDVSRTLASTPARGRACRAYRRPAGRDGRVRRVGPRTGPRHPTRQRTVRAGRQVALPQDARDRRPERDGEQGGQQQGGATADPYSPPVRPTTCPERWRGW
jgi:hypothetical protein